MRAWISQRREDGAKLSVSQPVGGVIVPYELVIVEVTDQGSRRPTKVARLKPIGEQRIVAELLIPKLVLFEGWEIVLSGIEEKKVFQARKQRAQTWQCKLLPPTGAVGFQVASTNQDGVLLPRRALNDASRSKGHLKVSQQFDITLKRHTMRAELESYQSASQSHRHLVDCDIAWMSEERFELSGLKVVGGHAERPEYVTPDGWLCGFDIPARELTKAEARLLR